MDKRFIEKAFDISAGKVSNATRFEEHKAFVEVFDQKQAEAPLKAKLLGSHFIHIKRHTSLSLS
jgi:hypothetical protein